jgi:hypothetical protein
MNSFLTSLPLLLPIALAWTEKQQVAILEKGRPLTDNEQNDARRAGVRHPEKIRVQNVDILPCPEDEEVMFVARRIGLFSQGSVGLTLGYGIYLRFGHWDNRAVLIHECVHVGQYERLGGPRPFLEVYLRECIDPGYPFGALEREAILLTKELCKADSQNKDSVAE